MTPNERFDADVERDVEARVRQGVKAVLEEVTLQWLFEMVYRVRNNLFHGGKYPPDPARDSKLLEASLALIEECLRSHDYLRKAYLKT